MSIGEPDDDLLVDLARVVGDADPVPDHVTAAAEAAYTWRTIDEELAEIAYDSAEEDGPVGVRGTGPRQIAYETESCTVEIELDPDAGQLIGQVVPPTPGRVELFGPGGEASVEPGANGLFRLDLPRSGPIALRVTGDVDLRTPWLTW